MDWINTANGLIALATGLIGLISAGVGVFFAVRSFIKAAKQKSAAEIWETIKVIANDAMREYEQSTLKGADKKKAVIESVKAGCKAVGIDADAFLDQLNAYIESVIGWYNGMQGKQK